MQSKPEDKKSDQTEVTQKPNEIGGIYFSSMVKITDPDTQQVLVQVRGDE